MSEEDFFIITGMSKEKSKIESLPTEWTSNSRTVSELEF
jgi:hypothetical protein